MIWLFNNDDSERVVGITVDKDNGDDDEADDGDDAEDVVADNFKPDDPPVTVAFCPFSF